MNFLAHILLSGSDKSLMIGNFIGDFVKGREVDNYDDPVKNGILLHRRIDEYTDNHEVVLRSKKRLRKKYRHYSPVIVDVFYDHILARNWKKFHNQALKEFTLNFYRVTDEFEQILPQKVSNMLYYMKKDNWLLNYKYLEGIHRALSGMASRTPFVSRMNEAVADLEQGYASFEKDFLEFFPDLQSVCDQFRKDNL